MLAAPSAFDQAFAILGVVDQADEPLRVTVVGGGDQLMEPGRSQHGGPDPVEPSIPLADEGGLSKVQVVGDRVRPGEREDIDREVTFLHPRHVFVVR